MPKIIVPSNPDVTFPPPLVVSCNDEQMTIPYDSEVDVPQHFYDVLANSTLAVVLVGSEAAAAGEPGGGTGGSVTPAAENKPAKKTAKKTAK